MNASKGGMGGSRIGDGQRSNMLGAGGVTPGPGHFNSDEWDVRSRSGKGSTFGTQKDKYAKSDRGKDLLGNVKNPGPGTYSMLNGVGAVAPSYSMTGRGGTKDKNWQPGPGQYQPAISSVKPDTYASAFGGGQRSKIA